MAPRPGATALRRSQLSGAAQFQVVICLRQTFWEAGGFNEDLPILEDGDLCLRLVQQGRIRLINRVVTSSDRRVQRWGPGKATAIYLSIGVLWGWACRRRA